MIELSSVTKSFANFNAVDNLSFSVAAGEVLGVLGPNGAGKSTCMKMISGFLQPDSGSITLFAKTHTTDPIGIKQMIGYLPEGAPSYGEMTVLDFLQFIADIRGIRGKNKKLRVDQVLQQLQLLGVRRQVIDTLSKGFKRRVGLAQAIIHDPKILILDEPTDGLDPNQKQQVRELIQNLACDKIVIISTHLLEEVSAVCSRAIIIDHGLLVADGTPAQLRSQSRYCGAITLEFDAELNSMSAVQDVLSQLKYVTNVEPDRERVNTITVFAELNSESKQGRRQDIYPAVSAAIKDNGWVVNELHMEQGRLDDVFRRLTGGRL